MIPLSNVRLVLMRPQTSENVGAAARAMKNCGLSDWAWVEHGFSDFEPAKRMAVHALELLDSVGHFPSMAEAVADCAWVVGTSSRKVPGKRRLTPRQVAQETLRRVQTGKVALVFGDERSGLRNEEIDACHDLSAIPASDEQPSFNLAQAILLYGYELRVAALEAAPLPPGPRAEPASQEKLSLLEAALRGALQSASFLNGPERHAVRDLLSPLIRAELTEREARLWEAALRALDHANKNKVRRT